MGYLVISYQLLVVSGVKRILRETSPTAVCKASKCRDREVAPAKKTENRNDMLSLPDFVQLGIKNVRFCAAFSALFSKVRSSPVLFR